MAAVPTSTGTYLSNLFNPQVVGDMIQSKLVDAMRFSPLCRIDTTLAGRAGDTITLPKYAYIGDATTVAEGADIPISQLTASTTSVQIHKIAKGVQLTDEAVLSGYGDPMGETISQLTLSIASQMDNEVLGKLDAITGSMAYTAAARATATDVCKALTLFKEDIDGDKVLFVSPETYEGLRGASSWVPNSDVSAEMVIRGMVGQVYGCQVVVSNKLTAKKAAFIVKPGALAVYMKRDTLVEADRDIINKSTVITADKHFAAYLYNESQAIKITETVA